MIFISKYRGYKQWIVPAYYERDAIGQRVFKAGKFVKFVDGRYETSDKVEIEALMENKVYGIDYWAIDEENHVVKKDNELTAGELAEEKKAQESTGAVGCPHCTFKAQSEFGLKAHIRARHK